MDKIVTNPRFKFELPVPAAHRAAGGGGARGRGGGRNAILKGMVEVPLFNGNKVGQMHDRVRYMCCLLSSCLEINKEVN